METEQTLGPLLERIRTEGVEQAKSKADAILEDAGKRADAIVKEAEEKADRVLEESRRAIEQERQAHRTAMSNAARDMVLGVRESIVHIAAKVVSDTTGEALTPEVVADLVRRMADAWTVCDEDAKLAALVPEKDLDRIESALLASVGETFRQGVELVPTRAVRTGFRIGKKGDDMVYDVSEEGVTRILTAYLSPRVAEFLQTDQDTDKG
ncbi:MAG: V-type ATP synthase subunit E family protein [Desulfatibacillaceae bacterium]